MKNRIRIISIITIAFISMMMLSGIVYASEEEDDIDTDDIYMMAYYRPHTLASLSTAIQEFDMVQKATGKYVEGIILIYHNNPEGRYKGTTDYEIRDGNDTGIPFVTKVHVRVKSNGWIIAWLTKNQTMNDLVFWDYNTVAGKPDDTTLGKAIWRMNDRLGYRNSYDKNNVNYYSYKYPNANRLLVGSSRLNTYFLIPEGIQLNYIGLTWYIHLEGTGNALNYAQIRLDDEELYYKNMTKKETLEHTKYLTDININITKNTRHNLNSKYTNLNSGNKNNMRVAIALIYKTD